ncbi:MAG: hypothetical protein JO256_07470 [Alphaproteobacteria bacterium]|nr:hypothetical protein [Alphaproteobacteria bacterium]
MPRWFRKKTFGYGWTPCSWEGWLATLLFVSAVFGVADPELLPLDPVERGVCIVALVAVLFAVTLATSGRDSDV